MCKFRAASGIGSIGITKICPAALPDCSSGGYKNQDVLRAYLAEREKKVMSIMMALFDQQRAVEQFGYDCKRVASSKST